jgi:hypothetical protein
MEIIKEIRLFASRESVSWSRSLEIEKPETKGEVLTVIDIPAYCVVRTNSYGFSIAAAAKLAAAARETYPNLGNEELEIVQFGGSNYLGTFGIIFPCPDKGCLMAPEGWNVIDRLEFTR